MVESIRVVRPLSGVSNDANVHAQSPTESGYASAESSREASPGLAKDAKPQTNHTPLISLTPQHLAHLNEQLENMSAVDILRFSRILFPRLYQSTAFGLTGLVTIDMLSRERV